MTTSEQKSGTIFYGWWIVLAAGVGLALHFGPIIVPTFGVFLKPLSQEFGWSQTQISLAFSLATLGITVALPLVGRLVDRFGARRVILPAVLLFGLSVLSLASLSGQLWHFYALYSLIGRVGIGYLFDRFFAPYVAVCFFGGSALGIFLLWSGTVGGLVFVAVVLVGLGLGAELDFMPYAISRYFGLRAFGEIYSYTFAAFTLGGVVGPLLMGAGFDATGSYSLVLATFGVAALTAAGLMIGLGPYRVWEVVAEAA